MYKNATVSIYTQTTVRNDEGTKISTYGYLLDDPTDPAETFRADVQPHKLTTGDITLYGITDKTAGVKLMLYKSASYVAVTNRAQVVSDFDGSTTYYDIKPINLWPNHGEALLVPVVGE